MEGNNIDETRPSKRSPDMRLVGGIWEMLRRGLSKRIGKYNDQLEFVIKVHAIFDGFDEDGSGTISPMELRRALRQMGIPVSAKEILEISQRYASDTDRIKYEEFEEMVKDLIPPPEFDIGGIVLEQKLMAMFKEMDSNGDLSLSPEELRYHAYLLARTAASLRFGAPNAAPATPIHM
jgi:Ca2+-binding EF-hand superfamily protein